MFEDGSAFRVVVADTLKRRGGLVGGTFRHGNLWQSTAGRNLEERRHYAIHHTMIRSTSMLLA